MPSVNGEYDFDYPDHGAQSAGAAAVSKTQRETPQWLGNKMVQLLDIAKLEEDLGPLPLVFLEPSAGTGALVEALLNTNRIKENGQIHCIELNGDKCRDLEIIQFTKVYHGDFLNPKFGGENYHGIIACPPFKDNVDVKHIIKMYDMLVPGGTLVSLTSPFWLTNNEIHQVRFRSWLAGKQHTMLMVPDNTFVEKNKTVPTAIIKITKPQP